MNHLRIAQPNSKHLTKSREGHVLREFLHEHGRYTARGSGPITMDIAVVHKHGRCQATHKTFPERSVYGLPFVELENKNYGKRKRGTPGKKKGLFQMTDISLCCMSLC